MIAIRPLQGTDIPAVLALAESLPDWFDEDARRRAIPADLQQQSGFVAVSEESVVGFITLFFAEGRLTIGWLAVRQDFQRSGIGSRLLEEAESFGREHGATEIATYTLGDGVVYEPYVSTRQFYFSKGFRIYQRNRTDNPNCQEEIRIKKAISRPIASDSKKSRSTRFSGHPSAEDEGGPQVRLVPELSVSDLEQSLRFYRDVIGFQVEFERPEDRFVYLSLHGSELMIEEDREREGVSALWIVKPLDFPRGRGLNLSIDCPDARTLIQRLADAGIPLRKPLEENWYRNGEVQHGERNFLVQDPDGYLLRFAESLGTRKVMDETPS